MTSLRVLVGLAIVAIAGCSATSTASTAPTTAAASQAAASQAPAAKVSFSYMSYVAKESDQVGACIDAYTKLNPNVTIDYQIVDHDALQQKLVTMAQTNTLPDMFWWNGQQIVDSFNQTHAELDLTTYIDDAFKGSLVDDALANMTTADGKIVGFPANMEVQGWVFNKALFDKYALTIPTTYDELKQVVPVFKKNGIDTIAYGSKEGWAVWGFEHWLELWGIWQQADAVFKDHTLKAVDADFRKAYEAEAELYGLGAFPANNATMSFDQAVSLFNAGKAAMITLPSDQLGKIIGQPNEKDYVLNWGITFPNSSYPQDVKVRDVGNAYGISAKVADDPAKLDAIIAFNKWRYEQDGFDCALKVGSIMPSKLTPAAGLGPIMTQQVALIQDPNVDTTINKGFNSDYAPYFRWNSNGDLWTQGWGTIRGNLENSLMNGSMTAKDIPVELAKMDKAIDEVLAQLPK
jgi:raffinose/stachyose/melibiose transport system substrate-binding protein